MTTVRRIFIIFAAPETPTDPVVLSAEGRIRMMELASDTILLQDNFGFVIEESDDAIYVMTEKAATILAGELETGFNPERIYVMETADGMIAPDSEWIQSDIEIFDQPDNFYVIYEFDSFDAGSNSYLEMTSESPVEGTVMFDEESSNDLRLSI